MKKMTVTMAGDTSENDFGTLLRMILKASLLLLLLLIVVGSLCVTPEALANNIAVTNAKIIGVNKTAHQATISFDIAWDNSWEYDADTRDAAWIFIKYKVGAAGVWKHAAISTSGFSNGVGHFGSSAAIVVPADGTDGKGAFLWRQNQGAGHFDSTGVHLIWKYGANNVADNDTALIFIKVFAIEMVYIPGGPFKIGSGGTEQGAFYSPTTPPTAYTVNTASAIYVGQVANPYYFYYKNESSYSGDQQGAIESFFPNGYSSFYLMKYEISQGQYADFLNTLTSTQLTTRRDSNIITYRYTIGGASPNIQADSPDRACNWLSWDDLAAYIDWAALRPMTELEFEKACRGPSDPVPDEYAWGSKFLVAAHEISGGYYENGTEVITTPNANCNCGPATEAFSGGGGSYGPLRCGIFATGSSTRETSGAGYYGNMELSGNIWERVITMGNPEGRTFSGTHGDGELDAIGNATNSDWPVGALGSGFRGGGLVEDSYLARVSDRKFAACTTNQRSGNYGGRAARTAG